MESGGGEVVTRTTKDGTTDLDLGGPSYTVPVRAEDVSFGTLDGSYWFGMWESRATVDPAVADVRRALLDAEWERAMADIERPIVVAMPWTLTHNHWLRWVERLAKAFGCRKPGARRRRARVVRVRA